VSARQTSPLRPPPQSVQTGSSREAGVEATPPAEALADRYAGDDGLLRLYRKKLPKRGWAGSMDALERAYVREARRQGRW